MLQQILCLHVFDLLKSWFPKIGQADLCHVMSWKTIQQEFLRYNTNKPGFFQQIMVANSIPDKKKAEEARKEAINDMNAFIALIFQVDKDAVAQKADDKGKMEYVKHGN